MLSREEYGNYCRRYRQVWNYLKSNSKPQDQVIREVCSLRGYEVERMYGILKKADFIYIEPGSCDYGVIEPQVDLGLFSRDSKFLLEGRYIFPVMDMLGNIIALIGWLNDSKKYITTPSKLFSKECLFYGMEQLGVSGIGGDYILVEGIFDCLSVRSLGLRCVATMGITCGRYKQALYGLFKTIVAIPDNDPEGRDVLRNDKWKLPSNGKYLQIKGNSQIKDIDKLCIYYDSDDIKETLLEALKEKTRIVTVEV